MNTMNRQPKSSSGASPEKPSAKREYQKPVLKKWGLITDLTTGGTSTASENNNPADPSDPNSKSRP